MRIYIWNKHQLVNMLFKYFVNILMTSCNQLYIAVMRYVYLKLQYLFWFSKHVPHSYKL